MRKDIMDVVGFGKEAQDSIVREERIMLKELLEVEKKTLDLQATAEELQKPIKDLLADYIKLTNHLNLNNLDFEMHEDLRGLVAWMEMIDDEHFRRLLLNLEMLASRVRKLAKEI